MSDNIFQIKQSDLENAKNTDDEKWFASTFSEAAKVVDEGGKVHIMKEFSDASSELVAIIDSPDLLDYYRQKYTP